MSTKNCSQCGCNISLHISGEEWETVPVTIARDEEATSEYPSTDDDIDESLIWTAYDINDVVEVPPEFIIKPAFLS